MKWNKTKWRGSRSTCHKSDVASAAAASPVYCFSQYAKIKHATNCDLQFAKITSHLIEPKQIRQKILWFNERFFCSTPRKTVINIIITNAPQEIWYENAKVGNGMRRGRGGWVAFSMIVSLFNIISWQSTFKGPQLLAAAAVAFKCKIIIASASLSFFLALLSLSLSLYLFLCAGFLFCHSFYGCLRQELSGMLIALIIKN